MYFWNTFLIFRTWHGQVIFVRFASDSSPLGVKGVGVKGVKNKHGTVHLFAHTHPTTHPTNALLIAYTPDLHTLHRTHPTYPQTLVLDNLISCAQHYHMSYLHTFHLKTTRYFDNIDATKKLRTDTPNLDTPGLYHKDSVLYCVAVCCSV